MCCCSPVAVREEDSLAYDGRHILEIYGFSSTTSLSTLDRYVQELNSHAIDASLRCAQLWPSMRAFQSMLKTTLFTFEFFPMNAVRALRKGNICTARVVAQAQTEPDCKGSRAGRRDDMNACSLRRSYTDEGGGSDATFGVADLQMTTQHWQCLPILQLHRKHCSKQKAGSSKSGPFLRYMLKLYG